MPQCARRANAMVFGLMVAGILAVSSSAEAQKDSSKRLSGFIGLGTGLVPDYGGSEGYRLLFGPVFDLRYDNFYANLWDGVGYDIIYNDQFELGVGLTHVRGRKAKYSPEGVGKLKSAVGSHAYARYYLTPTVSLTAGLTHAYGGSDGTLADLTLSYRFRPSKQVMLIPTVSATWASRDYMQGYFGINEAQAARSGLPEFDAGSGIKEVSAGLTSIYSLSRHWHITGTVTLSRYLGDAANSPLNERKWQPAGVIGVAYRF